jgi:hypothetical protein
MENNILIGIKELFESEVMEEDYDLDTSKISKRIELNQNTLYITKRSNTFNISYADKEIKIVIDKDLIEIIPNDKSSKEILNQLINLNINNNEINLLKDIEFIYKNGKEIKDPTLQTKSANVSRKNINDINNTKITKMKDVKNNETIFAILSNSINGGIVFEENGKIKEIKVQQDTKESLYEYINTIKKEVENRIKKEKKTKAKKKKNYMK